MGLTFTLTKIMVKDPAALQPFYEALGLKVTELRLGDKATGKGMPDVTQYQVRMTTTGDLTAHQLVLANFPHVEPQPAGDPPYPGPFWLVFHTTDVDESCAAVLKHGGRIHREPANVDHQGAGVRAGIVCDPEGNFIELFGPAP
jgi:predicted enzyme related to lactoylglutathione lyase